ncbi:MAG: hypothetical protein ACTSRZ_19150 [Promethearchaeota archaeon]
MIFSSTHGKRTRLRLRDRCPLPRVRKHCDVSQWLSGPKVSVLSIYLLEPKMHIC